MHLLDRARIDDHDAVVVADDEVAARDHGASHRHRAADAARTDPVWPKGAHGAAPDRKGQLAERSRITHSAVDDEGPDAARERVAAEDLAGDRAAGPRTGVDDEHLAGAGQVDRLVQSEVVPRCYLDREREPTETCPTRCDGGEPPDRAGGIAGGIGDDRRGKPSSGLEDVGRHGRRPPVSDRKHVDPFVGTSIRPPARTVYCLPEAGMDLQLAHRRAIVTGGSGGIGSVVAHRLAEEGCAVALVARTEEPLRRVAEDISAATGAVAVAVVGDLSSDDAATDVIGRAIETLGGVGILINTATGRDRTQRVGGLDDLTSDVLLDAFDDKVLGYVRCARAVAPRMRAAGWGRIVNVSGITARLGGSAVTSTRNAAVVALTEHLADELGPSGINVTAVHPGLTRTHRTREMLEDRAAASGRSTTEVEAELASRNALGRLVTADEVADVITFLASPRAVAITGDVVAVAGGVGDAIVY